MFEIYNLNINNSLKVPYILLLEQTRIGKENALLMIQKVFIKTRKKLFAHGKINNDKVMCAHLLLSAHPMII